jgi:MoxR-like ATPase
VRVRAANRRMGGAKWFVDLELEHQAAVGGSVQEVLDGVGSLAVTVREAHARAESDQCSLQVSARVLGTHRRTEIAADRRLRPDFRIADKSRGLGERLDRVDEVGDRRHRSNRQCRAVPADPVEPCGVEKDGAFRSDPAVVELWHQDRAAPENGDAFAVPECRDRLLTRAGDHKLAGTDRGHGTDCLTRSPDGANVTPKAWAADILRRMTFATIDELERAVRDANYLPDRGLATALYLSLALQKPLLLEGEAGVGKTEAAKSLAAAMAARLIRLQCYEGLDVAHAVYEWNYSRQLLHIRAAQEGSVSEEELFGPGFLIRRPLLEAIESTDQVVLLIDEVDRADDEFEAFLLEVLSDFQITIPEIGTVTARRRPAVVLTSNRTRELHDALKRRCLFHWIGHPSLEREIEIVSLRVPGIPERLAAQAAAFVQGLRRLELAKPPGVAETIDWAHALAALGREDLDARTVEETLGSVLKYHEDFAAVRDEALLALVSEARSVAAAAVL